MKGCLLGGAVLILVIAAVILNALFVGHTVEDLTAQVEALPMTPDTADTPEAIASLREYLESKEALLGISVSYDVTDKVVEALRGLEAAARAEDVFQYQGTLAILKDLIEDIGRLEKLSVKSLL